MDIGQWLTLITCSGLLALGVVAILRVRVSPLAAPLAALCLISFTWNFAVWAYSISGVRAWTYVDRTVSPWTAPAALSFVITFVGGRRRFVRSLRLAYLAFGVMSAIAASGFFTEWGSRAAVSVEWDNALAVLIIFYAAASLALLAQNISTQPAPEEQMRTRLVIAATVIGAILAGVELVLHDHIVVPSMLVTVVLLTVVAFRLRLFGTELVSLATLYGFALAVIAAGGAFIALRTLVPNTVLAGLTIFAIAMCWLSLLVQAIRITLQHRDRIERLAIVGKLATQMAHDLKNPLAALKGAAQYLLEEHARGRSIDGQDRFLRVMVSESERLSRLIDKYQRLGRMQASPQLTPVNDFVTEVLDIHRLAIGKPIVTKLELAEHLPECPIDADLAATALENLLRNASEAMPAGGTLTVRTEARSDALSSTAVAITVEDSGPGMDPREVEQAFEEFFTTKAGGSGLGLSLVKRVVEAHGGTVGIRSNVGRGTAVTLIFPLAG